MSHLLISLKDTLTALDPLWILRMTSIILFVSILGSFGRIRMAAGCSNKYSINLVIELIDQFKII